MFFRKRADANTTSTPPPVPLVVEPSGVFDGNDGKWSTFYINLGDALAEGTGQNFKVLISTSSPVTLVPQQSEWCNQDCAKKRGVQTFNGEQPLGYESDSSPTWKDAGIYTIPKPDWWNREELNGTLGMENVGLGESSKDSIIQTDQLVMKYTFEEYYLGSFGLAAGSVAAGNSEKSTFLYNLARESYQIPSVSYGHTAGASYRNDGKGITGNLVLGGYDSTRLKFDQGASINMPNDKNNTLVVGVQSILYKPDPDVEANTFSFTDDSKGFHATIDSTLPYLWLPDKVCDEFAERFNLEYDEEKEIYTVDSNAHRDNQRLNATVSFRIGTGPEASEPFTSIVFPYDAFYYTIDEPIVENATQYFPIKKSPNGIYVLGRTFLQESYIIVDYERYNFTVAPVLYSENTADQNLVPIYNKTYSPPSTSLTPIPSGGGGGGGGLSPGTVAGIVVGVVVLFLFACLGFFFWWKKRRQAKQKPYAGKIEDIDTMVAGTEVKHRRVSELDSEPPNSPKSSIAGLYGRDQKDLMPFPPINEMESPPVELYSPPPLSSSHSDGNGAADYFNTGGKVRRRGATRESSGNNTPGTPGIPAPVELPGDDGKFQVGGVHFEPIASPKVSPAHSRGPSDASLHSRIDEVIKRPEGSTERKPETQTTPQNRSRSQSRSEEREAGTQSEPEAPLERRPSHTRGLSDTTVQSDTTAVSQPTPEELEEWAMGANGPRRPLSE